MKRGTHVRFLGDLNVTGVIVGLTYDGMLIVRIDGTDIENVMHPFDVENDGPADQPFPWEFIH